MQGYADASSEYEIKSGLLVKECYSDLQISEK